MKAVFALIRERECQSCELRRSCILRSIDYSHFDICKKGLRNGSSNARKKNRRVTRSRPGNRAGQRSPVPS